MYLTCKIRVLDCEVHIAKTSLHYVGIGKVFMKEYPLYEGINLLLDHFRALNLDLKKKIPIWILNQVPRMTWKRLTSTIYEDQQHSMSEAALNAFEKKVLALKTIQKSSIYNQGKFNGTDSLFSFVCSQNNKLYLSH